MPLVLFTGFPCSGKSTVARELIGLLQAKIDSTPSLKARNYSICYHSDESLGIKHSDYITSQDERKLRSELMSAVKRDLSKNKIVILDSLNYIKGFRYQLHCEVKNLATSFCLIHVMCPVETIQKWNKDSSSNPWDSELLTQLIQRFEEPNPQNRWDSPLFPILVTEDTVGDHIDGICSAVFAQNGVKSNRDPINNALLKPNNVAVLKPAQQSNFVQLLDIETTKIVKLLMQHVKSMQSVGGTTTRVIVSEDITDINDERCSYVDLKDNNVTLAQLQRLKRQFILLNKVRGIEQDRIVPLFADFLTKQLNES